MMAIVVKSKIKGLTELQVSEEVARELDKRVEDILKAAEGRAKANGRRTIFARDL